MQINVGGERECQWKAGERNAINAKAAWTRQSLAIISVRVLGMRPANIGDGSACFNYRITLQPALDAER
jgi:hypothetical protein